MTQNNKTWYKVQYNGQTGYVEAEAALTEVTASASPTPTSTFVIGTMIPINYEDETIETQTSGVPWGLIGGAVVIIGGAGGAYAYALNQNKKRKAAAARAAASRRAATAAGTTAAGAAGAASPYARRAAAAPIAPGTKQNDTNSQNKPAGSTPYSGVKNPYSSGSITGTQKPTAAPRPDRAPAPRRPAARAFTAARRRVWPRTPTPEARRRGQEPRRRNDGHGPESLCRHRHAERFRIR